MTLNDSFYILLENENGELILCQADDITPEMLQIESPGEEYFSAAVEASILYINQKSSLNTVTLAQLHDYVSMALITPRGKLIYRINLLETLSQEALFGELPFLQKLKNILLSLNKLKVDLVFIEGIRECSRMCTHRQYQCKTTRHLTNYAVNFIRDFTRFNLKSHCTLVIL